MQKKSAMLDKGLNAQYWILPIFWLMLIPICISFFALLGNNTKSPLCMDYEQVIFHFS